MHATFGKQMSYYQGGIEVENWASFFNPGQSFGCDHGFVLMNKGIHAVCTRPPAQNNKFIEHIDFDKFQKATKNKPPLQKMLPNFDYFRKGHSTLKNAWNPFRHHYWDHYYYGNYYNSFHFYHSKYHRYNHKTCYVSDKKMVERVEKENIGINRWRSKQQRSERECVTCAKGYYMATAKKKIPYFINRKYCKKCTRRNCQICGPRGCKTCKPGYWIRLGQCIKCKDKYVWDMWSRRCFRRKKNRYMDIHYNNKEQTITVADLFSVGKDVIAIFDFEIHYRKKTKKVEPALFQVTAIQGGIESSYNWNSMPQIKKRRFHFRAPTYVGSDMTLKITIKGKNPKNMKHYKLRRFMYSLQPFTDPNNPRIDVKDVRENN